MQMRLLAKLNRNADYLRHLRHLRQFHGDNTKVSQVSQESHGSLFSNPMARTGTMILAYGPSGIASRSCAGPSRMGHTPHSCEPRRA